MATKKLFDWENILITGRGLEPARTTLPHYKNKQDALDGVPSSNAHSLDGEWKFKLVNGVQKPTGSEQIDYDDAAWGTIQVPGLWQLQGYGRPRYYGKGHNDALEIRRGKEPHIPHQRQQIGVYRKTFRLPHSFEERPLFLHFGGVKSAVEIWVNGRYVGYSQGSLTAHEFNVTDFCKAGQNTLAVFVYRYCDGSFLEGEQLWDMSGLCRSVTLYAEPPTQIRDFYIKTSLNDDLSAAVIEADLYLRRFGGDETVWLKVSVPELGLILNDGEVNCTAEKRLNFSKKVQNPTLWSDETPHLYTLLMEITSGGETSYKTFKFGVREVRISGGRLYLNGKELTIKGVNRYDFQGSSGWHFSKEQYIYDIQLMKQLNINAVRVTTPCDSEFYRLCDEYGLLVMNQAEVASRSARRLLNSGDEKWAWPCIDRMQRLVLRDRNHASVFFWSLGSNAGDSSIFAGMRRAAQKLDSTRPFHYDGAHGAGFSDVIGQLYPDRHTLQSLAAKKEPKRRLSASRLFYKRKKISAAQYQTKPVLLTEYAPSIGNSVGNFDAYGQAFKKHPHLCGGFVWSFADLNLQNDDGTPQSPLESIMQKTKKTGVFSKDWLNAPHFCYGGLVNSERRLHPAALEVKKGYQPFEVIPTDIESGQFEVQNNRLFKTMETIQISWLLQRDGDTLQEGQLPRATYASLRPGARRPFSLPQIANVERNDVVTVTFLCTLVQDTPAAKAGHVVAMNQHFIHRDKAPYVATESDAPLRYQVKGNGVEIAGDGFDYIIRGGMVASIKKDGAEYLRAPLRPNTLRPLTDNDIGLANYLPFFKRFNPVFKWGKAASKLRFKGVKVRTSQGRLIVTATWKHPLLTRLMTRYTIHKNGDLMVHHIAQAKKLPMLRAGVRFALEKDFDAVEWVGNGPQENYADRHHAAPFGRYTSSVEDLAHPYLRPQETGSRGRVQYLEFFGDGRSVQIETLKPLDGVTFSAQHHRQQLVAASPKRQDFTAVQIDGAMSGVGGDLPAIALTHPRYQIKPKRLVAAQFVIKLK